MSTTIFNNSTDNSSVPAVSHNAPVEIRALFGTIACMSFLCNGVLCAVILRARSMLTSSYNVLVLVLAITDALTGVFLSASPQHVLGHYSVSIPEGVMGELFCRLIDSLVFVWVFAKFSVAIVTCMAIERWYALTRPLQYKVVFTRRRVMGYVCVLGCISLIVNALVPLELRLRKTGSKTTCVFEPLIKSKIGGQVWTVGYCLVTVFFPFTIITATYVHIRIIIKRQVRNPQARACAYNRRRHLEIQLCRMSAIVALFLGICFIPNQISYILYKFDVGKLDSPEHLATIVLSMLNSFVNPWVYCFTNKAYRREFGRLLCPWLTHAHMVVISGADDTQPGSSGGTYELH